MTRKAVADMTDAEFAAYRLLQSETSLEDPETSPVAYSIPARARGWDEVYRPGDLQFLMPSGDEAEFTCDTNSAASCCDDGFPAIAAFYPKQDGSDPRSARDYREGICPAFLCKACIGASIQLIEVERYVDPNKAPYKGRFPAPE